MASEIKVDTVSEKTSANGVTIDGVNIKDSKIVTANSVDSDVYVDGSIDTAHIADGQITTAKLSTAVFTGATDIGAAIVDADLFLMDDGAGGTIRKTTASRLKTYAGGAALDDVTVGDAASTLATSAGNITIDAQAGDADIIFKGTDGSTDITALTIDMSDGGILQTRAGVGFPSTRVASTGVNVLDDYEEGEMASPIYVDNQQQTDYSSGRDKFSYIKIGRLVHCFGYVDTNGQTLVDTGVVELALPFPVTANSSNVQNTGIGYINGYLNNKSYPAFLYLNSDDTKSDISYAVATSTSNSHHESGGELSVLNTSHRLILMFSFTYNTDG